MQQKENGFSNSLTHGQESPCPLVNRVADKRFTETAPLRFSPKTFRWTNEVCILYTKLGFIEERMNEMKSPVTIDLKLNEAGQVKFLNDNLSRQKKNGIRSFLINIREGAVYPNVAAPIAGLLDYYRKQGLAFDLVFPTSASYVEKLLLDAPLDAEEKTSRSFSALDRIWHFKSSAGVNALVNAFIEELRQKTIVEVGVTQSVEWCINETLDNVLQHAQSDGGYVMAQIQSDRFALCVFDVGIGFFNSLRKSKHHPSTPLEAIRLAMGEKITRDESIGQGNGLWGMSSLVRANGGSFTIRSDGATYQWIGEEKTWTTRGFRMDSKRGTSMIDLQLRCNVPVNIATILNGHTPVNLMVERWEGMNGDVVLPVRELSEGTGTRQAGEKFRTLVLNFIIAEKKNVKVDFSGVRLLSSSFADEFIGKIIAKYGFPFFIQRISLLNIDETNAAIIDRSVKQRMAQSFDPSISDVQ